jgi:hypothetical protein
VCFSGLYHVSDPAAMLEKLCHKTNKYTIIQTPHVVPARLLVLVLVQAAAGPAHLHTAVAQ